MPKVYRRKDRPSDRRYWIDYADAAGIRHRVPVSPNKRDAEEILSRRLAEAGEAKFLPHRQSGETRFDALAKDYNERVAPTLRNPAERVRTVNVWVKILGRCKLRDIRLAEVEKYRAMRLKKAKPATCNREVAVLKRVLNVAVSWGLIEHNPVDRIRMLPERNQRLRYATAEEATRLVEVAAPHLGPLCVTALNSGARLGELLGLRWIDVDFKSGTLSFVDTKNGRRRDVPMNEAIRAALAGLPRETTHVFVYKGKPMKVLGSAFDTAVKRAGLVDFHFHDLRHTFASHMAMAGVDMRTLQQLLGHRTLQMTMRYAHLAPEHAMRAVEKIDLGRAGEVRDGVVAFAVRGSK